MKWNRKLRGNYKAVSALNISFAPGVHGVRFVFSRTADSQRSVPGLTHFCVCWLVTWPVVIVNLGAEACFSPPKLVGGVTKAGWGCD